MSDEPIMPSRFPGPVEIGLTVDFDEVERDTDLMQRWDQNREAPNLTELTNFVFTAFLSLKAACLQLAAQVDRLNGWDDQIGPLRGNDR